MACPRDWIRYNGTRCACGVGQVLNRSSNTCHLFGTPSEIFSDSGVNNYAFSFPETIFSFDSIRKFTQSQAVFLEATLVALLSWLLFCFALRFTKLRSGKSLSFNLRWWISRLDICFSTRHWLDDQLVVKKRKTELGGTLSIASWILFTGLFAALLYQIITKRSIEVHNVRATNAPDLATFFNDMEFNITTVSNMSCLNLRGIGNLITANSGFDGRKVASLTDFASYMCQNTSIGPTITFKCSNCRLLDDYMYISWQFVDLPDNPAAAAGFQFNITTKNQANHKQMSFVSGTLKNGSVREDRPVTFRGTEANILKFHLIPRIYRNLHDLKLIQPVFHDFSPGSSYSDEPQLRASLERSSDGLVNTTLFLDYLSAYVVEVDHQNIMGPVSFLADLGGLYCISIGIFFYLLVQCEYRIKRLRNEDSILRKIRSRHKAQEHWGKLRKYVMFTWGGNLLDDSFVNSRKGSCFSKLLRLSVRNDGSILTSSSSRKQRQQQKMDSISFNKKTMRACEKLSIAKNINTQKMKSCQEADSAPTQVDNHATSRVKHPLITEGSDLTSRGMKFPGSLSDEGVSQPQSFSHSDDSLIPLPPPIDFEVGSGEELEKKIKALYDYNVLLREKLLANESTLNTLAAKFLSPAAKSST